MLGTHPVEIVVGLGFAQVQSLALVGGSPLQQVVEDVVVALVPPLRADPRLLQQILLYHRPATQARLVLTAWHLQRIQFY